MSSRLARRRDRFKLEHPRLYAARHVVKGAGEALVALVGFAFLLALLPAIPLPAIDLPELPWPSLDLPLPEVDLPSVPGWIAAIVAGGKIWVPLLVGIALAARELRRRRRPS